MTDYVAAYMNSMSHYNGEAIRLAASIRNDATITDGVIRWNSNGRVPPMDVVAFAAHLNTIGSLHQTVSVDASAAARDAETSAFLAEYRAARANGPTAEERFEARAAFGPGVDLVDVVTGRKWRT